MNDSAIGSAEHFTETPRAFDNLTPVQGSCFFCLALLCLGSTMYMPVR